MTTTEIIQNSVNVALIAGMTFTVYKSLRGPQEKTERQDAVMREQINQLNNMVREQTNQLKSDLVNLRDNHVHTLDIKFDGLKQDVGDIKIKVAELATIINERIPKK